MGVSVRSYVCELGGWKGRDLFLFSTLGGRSPAVLFTHSSLLPVNDNGYELGVGPQPGALVRAVDRDARLSAGKWACGMDEEKVI